ncbi:protein phosphatase Slingshot homolog [Rhincodon typus]|uniref:protein phosphatase Slingshot homolog n=1 Tax=Rhincodon typus TaxID=259920 RepID=UPI00202FE16E|nr:protein phosphatase Slingshot homolog [Rhincodon typus]
MGQGSALLFATVDDERAELPHSVPEASNVGALQHHMQLMCNKLRQDDTITLAVRLESAKPHRIPYFVMVSNTERVNVGENIILGMDIIQHGSEVVCTIGLVLPVWSDTQVFLDGDG